MHHHIFHIIYKCSVSFYANLCQLQMDSLVQHEDYSYKVERIFFPLG